MKNLNSMKAEGTNGDEMNHLKCVEFIDSEKGG